MKRILLLATVAALMSVMLVVSAASAAFAHNEPCPGPRWGPTNAFFSPSDDRDNDALICSLSTQSGPKFKEDHDHNKDG
jgi:hypothetical protein